MKKIITAFCLSMMASVCAFAQTNTSADDYKKAEFFVGFSHGQIDTGFDSGNDLDAFFDDRLSFNGFNASGVVNVSRYIGIKGDVSGTYRNKDELVPVNVGGTTLSATFRANQSRYNFLGGIQFKDNASTARVKPFAYALVGAGHTRFKAKDFVTCQAVGCPTFIGGGSSDTGLAGAFGGGLDIKLSDRIDFRVLKIDYNPTRFYGYTQHNARFGIGFVFK